MEKEKKMIYVTLYDFDKGGGNGVIKKILQQVKAFGQYGIKTDYFFLKKKAEACMFMREKTSCLDTQKG